jgi:hypothetical protein
LRKPLEVNRVPFLHDAERQMQHTRRMRVVALIGVFTAVGVKWTEVL